MFSFNCVPCAYTYTCIYIYIDDFEQPGAGPSYRRTSSRKKKRLRPVSPIARLTDESSDGVQDFSDDDDDEEYQDKRHSSSPHKVRSKRNKKSARGESEAERDHLQPTLFDMQNRDSNKPMSRDERMRGRRNRQLSPEQSSPVSPTRANLKEWNCPVCTFVNPGHIRTCKICRQGTPPRDKIELSSGEEKEEKICGACTFSNPANTNVCNMCGSSL